MLPHILPMLANKAEPFDSPEFLFEVKWDGVRCLAAIEEGQWRLWGRDAAEYTRRYPELAVLGRLPSGTLVDGELISVQQGRPDLTALLRRHQLVGSTKISRAARLSPVQYVLFDLLYYRGQALLDQSLVQRRARLAELVEALAEPGIRFSEGVPGSGRDFFQQVVRQGHEGVVAKHVSSHYRPGRRSPAWRKIKPPRWRPGVIIGYQLTAQGSLDSLLVAALEQEVLRYVGALKGPFRPAETGRLLVELKGRARPQAAVACAESARWVEPELFCRVGGGRWTRAGELKGATFGGLLPD
jgi:ATP-dependent DNA ligase